MSTAIQWTDETWNPVTGCTKVSPGCAYCYITRTPPFRIEGRRFVRGTTGVRLHPDRLDQPLRWRKPRRIFVNSLSDLFHDDVPLPFIAAVFSIMEKARRHTFQVLTKRPAQMSWAISRVYEALRLVDVATPLPNVWLGVSVENQRMADERIPLLLETPAAVRFLSVEPLLGPVDLRLMSVEDGRGIIGRQGTPRAAQLDWVIAGGESGGPEHRRLVTPCHCSPRRRCTCCDTTGWKPKPHPLWWVRTLARDATAASVPFFFKQWGGPKPTSGGRLLDGQTRDEMPQGAG